MNQRERFTTGLLSFLWKKKWWWSIPMILTLLALGILVVFGPTQPNRPSIDSMTLMTWP